MVVTVPVPARGDTPAFTLEGILDEHAGAPCAVVCHPHPAFGGRMDTPLVVDLARALHAAGLSTLRFNFRGLAGSGGTPTGGLVEQDDVAAAAAFARARGAPRVVLAGYSFGALMAARALAAGLDAAALVAVAFPTSIIGDDRARNADIIRALDRGLPTLFLQGGRDPLLSLDKINDWAAGRPHVTVETLPGCAHFFHDDDAQVICARAAAFLTALERRG
jgi:hypothetical protein